MSEKRVPFWFSTAAILLLWFSGIFSSWALMVIVAFAIIGHLACQITPTTFATPIMIGVGLIVILVLGTDVIISKVFVEGHYFDQALNRSKLESDMKWAERIDPHAREYRERLAEKCRASDTAAGKELEESLKWVNDLAFSSDLAGLQKKQDKITEIQKFRAKCREAVLQSEPPENTHSTFVEGDGLTAARNAIPFFTSKSGLIVFLGIIFLGIGWFVTTIHKPFGAGIMVAGIVMVLAGAGDWLSSQNSLFAQLRDGIMGDYNQPWYVTVLALTAIGVLVMALFGIETRVKFSTVMVAVLLLILAWFARPDASLSDVSKKFEGVGMSLPSSAAIFGGNSYVSCKDHAEAFIRIGEGGSATCWQDLGPYESVFVHFYGNRWRLGGTSMSGVSVRLERDAGRLVYEGPYRDGTLPPSSAALITNGPKRQKLLVKVDSPR